MWFGFTSLCSLYRLARYRSLNCLAGRHVWHIGSLAFVDIVCTLLSQTNVRIQATLVVYLHDTAEVILTRQLYSSNLPGSRRPLSIAYKPIVLPKPLGSSHYNKAHDNSYQHSPNSNKLAKLHQTPQSRIYLKDKNPVCITMVRSRTSISSDIQLTFSGQRYHSRACASLHQGIPQVHLWAHQD